MLPKLKISIFLLKRLERIKQQSSGCLFGVFYGDGTLLLMGFNLESTIGQLNYEQIQYKFPAELDLCGLVKFGDCTDAEAHLNEILKDVDITDNPILLQSELGTLVGLRASIFMHGRLEEIPYEVMQEDELHREFCFSRLRCNLSLYTEQTVDDLRRQMHAQRKLLSGGSVAFRIEPSQIYVTNTGIMNHTNECEIADLLHSVSKAIAASTDNKEFMNSGKENKKRNKNSNATNQELPKLSAIYGAINSDYDVVNIEVLRCKTRERLSVNEIGATTASNTLKSSRLENANVADASKRHTAALPAVSMCVQQSENKVFVPLNVEAMAMLYKHTNSNRLYDILIESICRALRLYEHSMLEQLLEDNEKAKNGARAAKLRSPQGFHFLPQEIGHFITCAYLTCIPDDDSRMEDKRKRLHRHFGIPAVRPYFRRMNRCRFRNEMSSEMPLLNTHIGVRASGVVDGVQYLVQGNYQYYHYLQQEIQDKGWGCAYRSLQTICSWLLLQGYTTGVVPTHKEIQSFLVHSGDKPSSFLDSTQWIGSVEVAFYLQGNMQIESKIRHVYSGAELAALGPELAQHFQVQGTPIMIGGGVLAHTIIGVDYCAQSGEIKFLILDPHYTGSDDLDTIQSKGWCGWKGLDFWDKQSYYNLCMPQRPIVF